MFGCCGYELTKFKLPSGVTDDKRLARLVDQMKAGGATPQQIDQVKQCTCPCHIDGQCVMC